MNKQEIIDELGKQVHRVQDLAFTFEYSHPGRYKALCEMGDEFFEIANRYETNEIALDQAISEWLEKSDELRAYLKGLQATEIVSVQ